MLRPGLGQVLLTPGNPCEIEPRLGIPVYLFSEYVYPWLNRLHRYRSRDQKIGNILLTHYAKLPLAE